MAGEGAVYLLPPDSESGPEETDGAVEQADTPLWRRWISRGLVVLFIVTMVLYLAAWDSAARRRMSMLQRESPPVNSGDLPRLWSWRSIFGHLGIPWYDDTSANVGDKGHHSRSGEGANITEAAEDNHSSSREADHRGSGAAAAGHIGRGKRPHRPDGHNPQPPPPQTTTTLRPGSGPPPLDTCKDVKQATENGVPTCPDQRSCLCIVDLFLQQQPRGPMGLLQTRAGSLGGGPCGDNCTLPHIHRRCDTYDNALAVIYYTKRGYLAEAKKILDVFTQLLYPSDPSKVDPSVMYDPPSGRKMTLLATAYSTGMKTWAGEYHGKGVADKSVDTGNNAWAALAYAHFAAAANESCYADVARDILHALRVGGTCGDGLQGFLGRMPPTKENYRSSEHNIDVLALARMLGEQEAMAQASHFVRRMYLDEGPHAHAYRMGEISCGPAPPLGPDLPVPADVIYWGLLAGADPDQRHVDTSLAFALGDSPALQQPPPGMLPPVPPHAAAVERLDACCRPGTHLACCPNNCCGPGGTAGKPPPPCCMRRLAEKEGLWEEDVDIVWKGGARPLLNGTRFTTDGHGVQWEVSAGAAMALVYYEHKYKSQDPHLRARLEEVRNSLRHLLAMYEGVPASILGGNYDAYAINDHNARYPGGTDTGISFTYLRYRHVASTAWTGLLMLYQAKDGAPVFEDANPFAPPARPMPAAVKGQSRSCKSWLDKIIHKHDGTHSPMV